MIAVYREPHKNHKNMLWRQNWRILNVKARGTHSISPMLWRVINDWHFAADWSLLPYYRICINIFKNFCTLPHRVLKRFNYFNFFNRQPTGRVKEMDWVPYVGAGKLNATNFRWTSRFVDSELIQVLCIWETQIYCYSINLITRTRQQGIA